MPKHTIHHTTPVRPFPNAPSPTPSTPTPRHKTHPPSPAITDHNPPRQPPPHPHPTTTPTTPHHNTNHTQLTNTRHTNDKPQPETTPHIPSDATPHIPIITGTSHPHVRVLSSPYRSRPIPLIFDCLYNPYTPPPIPPPLQQHRYRSLLSLKYALGKLTCSPAHTRIRIHARANTCTHKHTRRTPHTPTATDSSNGDDDNNYDDDTDNSNSSGNDNHHHATAAPNNNSGNNNCDTENHCEISLQTYTAARTMRTPQETHRGNLRQSAPKTHRNTPRKQH